MTATSTPQILVLACGALARELLAVFKSNGLSNMTLECLPGEYHMHPEKIIPALEERLADHISAGTDGPEGSRQYDRVLIGYGDCGTGGQLDAFCAEHGFERLPGDHCYQFFAGTDHYLGLQDEEPGTFYLTDYLAKHFDLFVVKALGIDRHPELASMYFGNYRRMVFLQQVADSKVEAKARAAAETLGLEFELIETGYGELEPSVVNVAFGRPVSDPVDAVPIGMELS